MYSIDDLKMMKGKAEDINDIYGDYDSTGFTEAAEPEIIVEVEKDTLQLLLDAFNVKN